MAEWIRAVLDLVMIGLVGVGLVQATRLIKQLSNLQDSRVDMERFVHEFNATVSRAEAGIKGLRQAARDSGDDLEKLVEKGSLVRDELQFIVGSAEQIAERLSQSATNAAARSEKPAMKPTVVAPPPLVPASHSETQSPSAPAARKDVPVPSSRAEKELLQALQKLS